MPLSPEVQARLRARFERGLVETTRRFEQGRADLIAGEPQAEAYVRDLAHRLAGSAASFGWPSLTDSAMAVLRAEKGRERAALDMLIEQLHSAIECC